MPPSLLHHSMTRLENKPPLCFDSNIIFSWYKHQNITSSDLMQFFSLRKKMSGCVLTIEYFTFLKKKCTGGNICISFLCFPRASNFSWLVYKPEEYEINLTQSDGGGGLLKAINQHREQSHRGNISCFCRKTQGVVLQADCMYKAP